MAVKVLEPRNLNLNAVDYPLASRIQRQVISQFPAKIQIGDSSHADESPRSSWVINDLTGGLGVENMIEGQHQTRFYDSTVWTLDDRRIHLNPLLTTLGGAGITATANKMLMYASKIYVCSGSGIGDGQIERYNASTTVWDVVLQLTGYAYTDLIDWTNAAGTQRIYVAVSNGYYAYSTSGDSGAWTYDGANSYFKYFTAFDNKLIGAAATRFEYSTDGTTWTVFLTHNKGFPNALRTMRHPDTREEVIVAVWSDGMYWIDFWTAKMYKLLDLSPQFANAGKNLLVHRDETYMPAMHLLYRLTGSVVSSIGLRKGGDVWPYDSRIVTLAGFGDIIIAGADQRLYVWNGRGWHVLFYTGSYDAKALLVHSVVLQSDNTVRIYLAYDLSSSNLVGYIDLPAQGLRPSDYASFNYAASGYLQTSYFDGGFPEWNKVAMTLELTCSGMSANETITASYRADTATSWTTLGSAVVSNGLTTLYFPNSTTPTGTSFKKIQLKFAFARGSTATNTPILETATLRFYRSPKVLYGYRAIVDCSKKYKGREPAELIAALETAVATDPTVVMSYYPDGDKYVKVASMVGTEEGGRKREGQFTVTMMEMS